MVLYAQQNTLPLSDAQPGKPAADFESTIVPDRVPQPPESELRSLDVLHL